MTEEEWLKCNDPQKMLEFLQGRASDRKLRLFAVACCRRVWHLLPHESCKSAVDVAERFADGAATEQEMETVRQDAWEFSDHTVNNNEAFFDLDADALNATDAPAWAAEWPAESLRVAIAVQRSLGTTEGKLQTDLLRCIFGPLPFRPVSIDPTWLTPTVKQLAGAIYEERAVDRMPILADAVEDAGCNSADILNHCRQPGVHARGCWLIDLLLGKE